MDIGCPCCAATYRVPDTLLASGKPLRCVACGHEWIPAEPEAVAESEAALAGESFLFGAVEPGSVIAEQGGEPAVAEAEPPVLTLAPTLAPAIARSLAAGHAAPPPLLRRGPPHHPAFRVPSAVVPRPGRLLPMAWLASVLIVVIVLLGLVLYSTQIASAWPPFSRVAGLVGR